MRHGHPESESPSLYHARRFCRLCGSQTRFATPVGDEHPREVCPTCGFIHYDNPKTIAGAIVTYDDKLLLCKRAISPRYGLWTMPAGFMELDEHGSKAARRETYEESGAEVPNVTLFAMYTLLPVNQVYLMYHGHASSDQLPGGIESLEAKFIDFADIPWDQLAFPIIKEILQQYIMYRDGQIAHLPIVGEMTLDFTQKPYQPQIRYEHSS